MVYLCQHTLALECTKGQVFLQTRLLVQQCHICQTQLELSCELHSCKRNKFRITLTVSIHYAMTVLLQYTSNLVLKKFLKNVLTKVLLTQFRDIIVARITRESSDSFFKKMQLKTKSLHRPLLLFGL